VRDGRGGESLMRTSEVLRQARALIDTPAKWHQGGGMPADGPYCVAMACCKAAQDIAYDGPQTVIARTLGLPDPTGSLFDWNDAPERTHAEVLAAFDTAISYAEAAEQEFSPSACAPVDSIAGLIAKAHEGNIR
jgi:hypothetical protein